MILIKIWCLIKCIFGYHFWILSDKKNTKECFHCEDEAPLASDLWKSFKIHEGESETLYHAPHPKNESCEVCTPTV